MNRQSVRIWIVSLLSAVTLAAPPPLQAQDSLVAAQNLYAAAEYDNALGVLDRLSAGNEGAEERQAIELYRALCLLAVGRRPEAVRVIEAIVTQDPLYQPGSDLAPRVRAAFAEAKSHVLPTVVQQHYEDAKAAFDREDFEAAAGRFARVLAVLDDPDIGAARERPPLADLRTLARGFRDLSVKATPPPPLPAIPSAPPPPAPPAKPTRSVYTIEDADVVPPQAIRQELPAYPGPVPTRGTPEGIVEVLIDENGAVASATMVVPMALATYNQMVLSSARRWLYQAATVNGVPVKFRKRIQITVSATHGRAS